MVSKNKLWKVVIQAMKLAKKQRKIRKRKKKKKKKKRNVVQRVLLICIGYFRRRAGRRTVPTYVPTFV